MGICSMTGFGCAESRSGDVQIEVEAKSVNSRFLDVSFRIPPSYSRFEQELSKLVADQVSRGRVEITVSRKDQRKSDYEVQFNGDLFNNYLTVTREALKGAGISDSSAAASAALNLLQRREILELVPRDNDFAAEVEVLKGALLKALSELVKMRTAEGHELETEMLSHVTALEKLVKEIGSKSGTPVDDIRERLRKRLEKIAPELEIDPGRLTQEAALLAERTDVTEELARLGSHFKQFKKIVKEGAGGKKLEFLLQEMGREVNTTGSKTQNSEVTILIVEAKSLLEKLREQIQNIE